MIDRQSDGKQAALRKIESVAAAYARIIIKFRVLVILASLLMTAGLGLGLLNVQFAADARVFFGKNNPEKIALDQLEDTYSRSNVILFIVTPRSGNLFTQENLTAFAGMTESAWQLPYTLRVDSIANFNSIRADGDDIVVEPLYNPEQLKTEADAQTVRKRVLGEPDLLNRLISPNGDVAGITVGMVIPDGSSSEVHEIAEAARAMAAQWRSKWQQFEIRLTGGVIADKTFAEAGERDQRTLVPIMAVLIVIALAGFLRSWAATGVILAVIGATVISAQGFAGWIGIVMNAATGSSPIAVMVLVLASAVHLVLTWLQKQRRGCSGSDAVEDALAVNAAPISVTDITTAIGFLCMNFSDSPPLRDMGNIVAAGTLFGWVFTLSTLPALLSFLPARHYGNAGWAERLMAACAEFSIRRRVALIVVFSLAIPACIVGIQRIDFDDDYIRYFDRSFEFRNDTEYAERRLTGLNAIQFSLSAGESGGVFEPAFLANVDRFADWFESQPGVVYVDTITRLFKRLNRAVNEDNPAYYKVADSRAENAQNLLIYELGSPVGHDLNNHIGIDRSSIRLAVIVRNVSSGDIRELGLRAEEWLRANTPSMAGPATGMSVVFAYISQRNIEGMIYGTVLALLLISAIMLPAFQSIRFGILSLVPNLLPVFVGFGVWGFLVGQVNLASSVVCSMTIGIVVDDTVHIMMKYLRARRIDGLAAEPAVRQVMGTVGFALLITSVTLAAGFAVIAMSGFQLSQHLGSLTTIVILAALIADYFLLIPLLLTLDRYLK